MANCKPDARQHRTHTGFATRGCFEEAGFTLLEVLVALVIVVPALAVLLSEGGLAVGATRTSTRIEQALARAGSRLDAVLDDRLAAGERSGDEGDGFHWHVLVAPVSTAVGPTPAPKGAYAAGIGLYDVTVDVSWPGPLRDQTVTLATRRIGPAQ